MAGRSRKSIDIGRLSALVSRPGVDPRVWVALAEVTDVGFDAQEGIFADIKMLTTGEEQTAMVASPYTGPSYGFWPAVAVGDIVVVLVPQGTPDAGVVIIGQIWNAASPPPSEARLTGGEDTDVSPNIVIKTKSGAQIVLIAQGADLLATADIIKLQNATQSYVRGETYADAHGVFLDALKIVMTAIGVFATGIGGLVPGGAAFATTLNAAIVVFNAAVDTMKSARSAYLSTKIKGE